MSPAHLIAAVRARGGTPFLRRPAGAATTLLVAGELNVRAPRGAIDADLRQRLQDHRAALVAYLWTEELVAELAHAREWAAAHDVLPAGQPTGSEFVAKAMFVATADPHRALAAARRHYRALVEDCELLPMTDAAPQVQVGAA